MRWKSGLRHAALAFIAIASTGLGSCSAGRESAGFVKPELMQSYIPLSSRQLVVFGKWAAAFRVTDDVAVTNDHNLGLIPPEMVLARSRDYDLLFFRDPGAPVAMAKPHVGEDVIAYGQGASDDLREARGPIASLDADVNPRCKDCVRQRTMVFDADAGGGFSGGPVVDAQSGAVLGITFGYLDGKAANGGRRMYAYDIDLVLAEMHRLLDRR